MIKIIIADDHQLIIDGILGLLEQEEEIEVVATCHNGVEVLQKIPVFMPDLILLDLDMPEMNGLDCTKKIKTQFPHVRIAILTMHKEGSLIQQLMRLGVQGYFLKTVSRLELVHGIQLIGQGGEYFPAEVTKAIFRSNSIEPDVTQRAELKELTERETEILIKVAHGLTNHEIGQELFISPRTVDTHRTNLMRKLGLHSVAEMVRFAFQNKLVE